MLRKPNYSILKSLLQGLGGAAPGLSVGDYVQETEFKPPGLHLCVWWWWWWGVSFSHSGKMSLGVVEPCRDASKVLLTHLSSERCTRTVLTTIVCCLPTKLNVSWQSSEGLLWNWQYVGM